MVGDQIRIQEEILSESYECRREGGRRGTVERVGEGWKESGGGIEKRGEKLGRRESGEKTGEPRLGFVH